MQAIKIHLRNLTFAAVCLALCMALPFLTGQIPEIGSMLCPMHIPVLLAGFLCGPWWGMAVGAFAPLLRFFLFGMPPLFPTGVAMCFELAVYALAAGVLYPRLPSKPRYVYGALVTAMILGRLVWGVVMVLISGAGEVPFTWAAFLAGAFLNAVPGIILQLLLIPAVVLALRKAGMMRGTVKQ